MRSEPLYPQTQTLKRYALIFLAAIFVPSLILGWLALRTAGEQRVLIERQAADLHQAETDALAAEMRALIEEKQHAFDEIVRALISKQDAAALAGDYGNQLFSAWHEGGIPFAISPEGILVFPTPAHAVTNPAFEEFLWYNSAFLSNNTVEEVFQTQQTSSFKENSPHEKEAGRTARAATIPITTNPPSDKADTRLQKERSPPRSIVPLRGTPDTQSSAFSRVAPEFSNFHMAVEGAANGVLSRFVQNDLQLFFWTHPDPNEGWLFGLVLGPGELSRLASGILPKTVREHHLGGNPQRQSQACLEVARGVRGEMEEAVRCDRNRRIPPTLGSRALPGQSRTI